jgi:transposase
MIKHNILFIGLDTHKTFTEVAYIEDQRGAKSTHLGKILSKTGVRVNLSLVFSI